MFLVKQLDKKLKYFEEASTVTIPSKGWIHAIRKSLNMTLKQFSSNLGMSIQGARDLETREAKGSITLNSLKDAAISLDMKLIYGFVPLSGSLENLVTQKSEALAKKIVAKTHHTMVMENQENADDTIKEEINRLTEELKRELKSTLWD